MQNYSLWLHVLDNVRQCHAVIEGSARRNVRDGIHVTDWTVSLQNRRRHQNCRLLPPKSNLRISIQVAALLIFTIQSSPRTLLSGPSTRRRHYAVLSFCPSVHPSVLFQFIKRKQNVIKIQISSFHFLLCLHSPLLSLLFTMKRPFPQIQLGNLGHIVISSSMAWEGDPAANVSLV